MENVSSERKLFGEVVRNTHKYGSTTKPQPHHSKYVKHFISRVDTLQGIALKYGTTVEQIKRDNKLWTNDSLFLREHLFIPITNENNHLVTDDCQILSYEEVRPRSNSENVTCGATGTDVSSPTRDKSHSDKNSCVATESKAANSENNITGVDFFSKYDNSIAVIKSKVEKLEKESGLASVLTAEIQYDLDLDSPYQILEKETQC
ncbi:lysM and putative peptidoglycan-binding domain-containing protein 2-like isoform X2 [Dreissena polymorpha]|uniref:lysM and putative peptidoglycan-binding domain-containing protein 2-like isoform X2 n=1 Tax=Dreissena polymorpha TaxID=45954 RepID=UPI002265620A|nr:lysM and putative peptidoglycan-binding domain-containing protein 2-like isoform X2 [Dreissena polymorpha]